MALIWNGGKLSWYVARCLLELLVEQDAVWPKGQFLSMCKEVGVEVPISLQKHEGAATLLSIPCRQALLPDLCRNCGAPAEWSSTSRLRNGKGHGLTQDVLGLAVAECLKQKPIPNCSTFSGKSENSLYEIWAAHGNLELM